MHKNLMFMYALVSVCIFSLSDAIVIAIVLEAYSFSSVQMLLKSQGGIAISYYKDFGNYFFSIIVSLLTSFGFSVQLVCFVFCCCCCLKH